MFCPAFYRHKRAVTAIECLSQSSMLDCMGLFLHQKTGKKTGKDENFLRGKSIFYEKQEEKQGVLY